MRLPTLLNYQLALQNPRSAFANVAELRTGTTLLNAQGMPSVASGGFAATFTVDSATGRRFAVRCFYKQGHGDRRLRERYDLVHSFIVANPQLRFLVDVLYQDDGIIVNGAPYPMVRMAWASGEMLGVWIEDWIEDTQRDPDAIEAVRAAISKSVAMLHQAGAAHGDLQHGNILVADDLSVTLIDYDGMYLSTFDGTGLQATEQGHRNYQHPGRGNRFDSGIDAFAAAVIDLSLHALRERPALWDKFGGTGENLIFTARDFVDPDNSPVFAELAEIPAVAEASKRLHRACRTDYEYVDAVLSEGMTTAPNSGGFALVTGQIVGGTERDRLLSLEGETVTVFGTVQFATLVTGRQGRDVALINLGNYVIGDFTIVAYDGIARKLFADYGNRDNWGNRRLRQLRNWQVAITGTVVIYDNKGTHVPQIELLRTGLLRNLTDQQIASLVSPPPMPPRRPPLSESSTRTTPTTRPPATKPSRNAPMAAKPTAPQRNPADQAARRQAQLSEMYKNHPATTTSSPPPPHRHAPRRSHRRGRRRPH